MSDELLYMQRREKQTSSLMKFHVLKARQILKAAPFLLTVFTVLCLNENRILKTMYHKSWKQTKY